VVRGSRGGISARLIVGAALFLALASCGEADTATTTRPSLATTSTTASTTTTAAPATSVTGPLAVIDAEVLVPEGDPPFPAVVLVHGGGWVAGDPSLMLPLARFLTEHGYLTVTPAYTLAGETPGYPAAVDDVACAARLAGAHPDGDGSVVLLGHSAGAHLSAVVALDSTGYGESCPVPEPVVPDRLVGLAGPYDVARLGILMYPFFGGGPGEEPEAWVEGNPMNLVERNTGLRSLLMYGEEDGFIAPSFTLDFGEALSESGSEALIEAVEGARHNEMYLPEVVGDLILAWLDD
jgi:acetyl esterase/lipase